MRFSNKKIQKDPPDQKYLKYYATVKYKTLSRNSRNFKIFIFKPELSFLRETYKNDNKDELLDFTNSPYI